MNIRTGQGFRSFCFSPDGKSFAFSPDGDHAIQIKSIDGKLLSTLRDKRGRVDALAFSPNGRMLASGGMRAPLGIWDVPTGTLKVELAERVDFVRQLAFAHDGKSLVVAHFPAGDRVGKVDIWDIENRKSLHSVDVSKSLAIEMTFNPAGDTVAVGTDDGIIHLIDTKAGKVRTQLDGPPGARVLAVAYSLDGKVLHAAYTGTTVARWELATGRFETMTLLRQEDACAAAFSPDRRYIAVGDRSGFVWLWNTADGRRAQVFDPRFNERLEVVAFSPDGKWLASADIGYINTFFGGSLSHSTWLRIRPVRPDDVPKE